LFLPNTLEEKPAQTIRIEAMLLEMGFSASPPTLYRGDDMGKKMGRIAYTAVNLALFLLVNAQSAFAQASSEDDLGYFLEQIGDFLIRTVGPGVLVIGIAVAGVSMALGDEQGMRRGGLAAGGGALIMLSRAILDLIQNVTHF